MYHYVYQLTSHPFPASHYTGLTSNLERRLNQHNQGEVRPTANHRPWKIEIAIAFRDASKAAAFEQYLKRHSGRAFSKRHFYLRAQPKRLEKFGLQLAEEKSSLVKFNRWEPDQSGKFTFLGFDFYWGRSQKNPQILNVRRRTNRKKFQASLLGSRNG